MGTAIKHPLSDRVKPSFVIFDIQALWYFIAVPIWQQWTHQRVLTADASSLWLIAWAVYRRQENLAHCVTYLSRASKSNEAYAALCRARTAIRQHRGPQPGVPLHLRNATTSLAHSMGLCFSHDDLCSQLVVHGWVTGSWTCLKFYLWTSHGSPVQFLSLLLCYASTVLWYSRSVVDCLVGNNRVPSPHSDHFVYLFSCSFVRSAA